MGVLRRILNFVSEKNCDTETLKRFLDQHKSFTFGSATISFFDYADLDAAQTDFQPENTKKAITDTTKCWDESWLVIGTENLCNDPILVDTYSPTLPVYTAMYDNGKWNAAELAGSLAAFGRVIQELSTLDVQEIEGEILKDKLTSILNGQNSGIDHWWWESLLEEQVTAS